MARGLRKHFDQGGSAAMSGTVIFQNSQQANPSWIGPSSGSGMSAGNYSLTTPYSQAPTVQNAPSGGGGDGGGGGSSNDKQTGSSITSGVFSDVSMVYQNMNQNTLTNQQVANDIFNRNVQRKQLALNEATAASNLRGSAQNQIEQGITFGQSQQDRAGQQKIAAAWAAGVGRGLGGAKT